MAAARALQARLTKPAGSLGALEELSVRLAGLAGAARRRCRSRPRSRSSPATTACTPRASPRGRRRSPPRWSANFLAGGAVVNAFARQAGAAVTVVDVGVAAADAGRPARRAPLVAAKVRRGTRDLTVDRR